jgi:hypothetical protein
MFHLFRCIIAPGWTRSCQGSWRPKDRGCLQSLDPCPPSPVPDGIGFGGTGRTHRMNPTWLYRHSNRYLAWSEAAISIEVGSATATRRLKHTVRVRHEVVQVAVVIVVSSSLTAIRRDTTRSSATGILPGRASLVTAGCEAPGTSVSFIPTSSMQPVERQGWQRNRKGKLRLPTSRRSRARIA